MHAHYKCPRLLYMPFMVQQNGLFVFEVHKVQFRL